MTIEEYVIQTRGVFQEINYDEEDLIVDVIKALKQQHSDIDFEVILTKTYKAICSSVKLGKKHYIIWDAQYWANINGFLLALVYNDLGYNDVAQKLYSLILFTSVALRIKDESVQPVFSKILDKLKDDYQIAHSKIKENHDFVNGHILSFLKLYVLRHEVLHILSKEKSETFNLYKSTLDAYKDFIIDYEKSTHKSGIVPYPFELTDEIKNEIVCDVWAYTFCAEGFPRLNIDNSKSFQADMIAIKNAVIDFNYDIQFFEETIKYIIKSQDTPSETDVGFVEEQNKKLVIQRNRTSNFDLFLFSQLNQKGFETDG